MGTKEIQQAIAKMQVLKFHQIVCENFTPLFKWEMDVMSINKAGMMFEFEVKVSRSDFKADAKKGKQTFYSGEGQLKRWAPNYFSYVCPKDLIKLNEIGSASGLYYIDSANIIEIRKPKKLHSEIHNVSEITAKAVRLHQERIYLGCARLTYENKKRIEEYEYFKQQREQSEEN
jgi:hypothetical protein